jgi:PPOX class probable F420-dependent enzyme
VSALTWAAVADRLAPARNYWVGTTGRDGAPHAAPVWGVVVGEVLYFYTETGTAKARNLAADPRVVVHLESGDDVLIVRGTASERVDPALLSEVLAAFVPKYTEPDDLQYLPVGPPGEVVLAVLPTSALSWSLGDYESSQQRWSAP